jgi:hypothetical protein
MLQLCVSRYGLVMCILVTVKGIFLLMEESTCHFKRYVHRAIFYLNKEQVPLDLKVGYLTDLLITRLLIAYMLILYFYLHFSPFYINFFKTPSK